MKMQETITVVDYGMGNVGSVLNMLRYLGYGSRIVSNGRELANAGNIILPGVGHYKKAMINIRKQEIDKALEYAVYERKGHVLGICLGMQLLMDYSEEGDCRGLGYINGNVVKFRRIDFPVPHLGWNTIKYIDGSQKTFNGDEARFYFAHSYYVRCENKENIIASTEYGITFASIIKSGNILGVQFHPEKSHIYGINFLKNYMETIRCTAIE